MGRNEALFKQINDHIADVSRALPTSEEFEILCECARLDCVEKIAITRRSYVAARSHAEAFVVQPGHHLPEAERIVEQTSDFLVVEKFGEARAEAREAEGAAGLS
jgi:hypothetical protein